MVRTHTQARGQARGTTGFFAELNYQPSRLRSVAGSRQRRRTALKLPEPSSIPAVKEYRYVKAKDEIVPTSLPVKAQKNRYANAVWQVTVRALHEIFEVDRAGKPPASRSAAGRTDGIQKAHQGHYCDPCK